MKLILSLLIVNCNCISYIVANENIVKYGLPEDAFKYQDSELPISYRNHTSIVMCKIYLKARHRTGIAHYNLEDFGREISFDGNLCTHVVYQRLFLDEIEFYISSDEYVFMKTFNNFIGSKYPHLKTLAEFTFSTNGDVYQDLLRLVAGKGNQIKIAENLDETLRDLNISGAYFASDVYFSYKDKTFIDFAKVLKNQFGKYGRILATELFGLTTNKFDKFFNHVTQISRIFDVIVIRAWDFDNAYHGQKAHTSPLFSSELSKKGNIENIVLHFIFKLNVHPKNLVLGISMLAKPHLIDTDNTTTGKINIRGPLIGFDRLWIYLEVCYSALIKNESWRVYWDENSKVPYMEDGQRWITFDSPASVYEKVVFANKLGLLGVILEGTEVDDFNGICTKIKNPNLKAINVAFVKSEMDVGSQLCSKFENYKRNTNWNGKSKTDHVTVNPFSQSVGAKSITKINCAVDGPAIQNITWIKVNDKGEESRIISGENNLVIRPSIFKHNPCLPYHRTVSTLEIQSLDSSNSGKYICSVQSSIGNVREGSFIFCENSCTENEESNDVHGIIYYSSTLHWFWVIIGAGISLTAAAFIIAMVFKRNNNSQSTAEIVVFQNEILRETEYLPNACTLDELPNDPENYEITDDEYQLDRESILGRGEFGIVYKGRIKDTTVAVKSTKANCDKQYLDCLLQELKVLKHIGKHPNIVSLLGAKTNLLSQGIAYIFVEYCTLGNLEDFLRKSRNTFSPTDINCEDDGKQNRTDTSDCVSTSQLGKWSYQIITALQHLRRKKVIHGDLAARNILLSDINAVKITDFGLARKRYDYTNYIKKGQEPLPWRWMAIESLRDMTFSFQSDIWSLSITLWEIFSLAETPYPGVAYSYNFISELENGHRMGMPKYATNAIFELMGKCWKRFPEERPKIDEIEQSFFHLMIKKRSSSESSSSYLGM